MIPYTRNLFVAILVVQCTRNYFISTLFRWIYVIGISYGAWSILEDC